MVQGEQTTLSAKRNQRGKFKTTRHDGLGGTVIGQDADASEIFN